VLENRDLAPKPPKAKARWTWRNPICAPPRARPFPRPVVKAQTDVDAFRQAMDAAKKVFDSRAELFKEGALAQPRWMKPWSATTQAKGQFDNAQEHLRVLQAVAKGEQIRPPPRRWNPPRRIINLSKPSSAIRAFSIPIAASSAGPAPVRRWKWPPPARRCYGDGYLANS